jgi:hypothetical protein
MEWTEYISNLANKDAIILFIHSKHGVAIAAENLPYRENGSNHKINSVPMTGNDANVKHNTEYLKNLFSFENLNLFFLLRMNESRDTIS